LKRLAALAVLAAAKAGLRGYCAGADATVGCRPSVARTVGVPKKTESNAAGSNNATSFKNVRSESPAIGIPSIGFELLAQLTY